MERHCLVNCGLIGEIKMGTLSNVNAAGEATYVKVNGASSAEIGYLVGVTSSVQTQLNDKLSSTDTAVTQQGNTFNGVSQLVKTDAGGKVPVAILPTGTEVYRGQWNASTNTPTLSNSTIEPAGYYYHCDVPGSVNFGAGAISFAEGDHVISNGTIWQKEVNSNAVTSVNGAQGAVVIGINNLADVDATSPSDNDALIYDAGTSEWVHQPLGAVAYSNDYNDLSNTPTIPSGTVTSVSGTGTAEGLTLTGTVTNSGNLTLGGTIPAANVTGKVLTGYAVGSNTAIAAADTILAAFGKTQAQLNAIVLAGRLINFRLLTSGTTYTPTAGTNKIIAILVGGGAGGGGSASGIGNSGVGGGGSAGGECNTGLISVTNTAYSIGIGSGGVGGSSGGGTGGTGGNTGLTIGATTYLAFGGQGGLSNSNSTTDPLFVLGGASPALSQNGLINLSGAAGQIGFRVQNPTTIGGQGASSNYGCGGQNQTSGAGNAGTGFGAGGGGAATQGGPDAAGGAGAQGCIAVYEFS